MKRWILALTLLASPALASTTAFVGGTVAIGDGSPPIANGVVVIKDGRVLAAGADIRPPADATVVDARGEWVSAGLVSASSQMAIGDFSFIKENNDTAAAHSPFSAALDVSTALNPRDAFVAIERAGGITRAFATPQATRTIFGGQGAVISTSDALPAVGVMRAFQYVELGAAGAELAGGSRPAAYAELEAAFDAAQRQRAHAPADRPGDVAGVFTPADIEALEPVVAGQERLFVHVERASDILHVLSLKQRYPALRLVLVGAAEGWMVAEAIAAAHVPVIAQSINDIPSTYEQLGATESNVGRLKQAGVEVAISTIDFEPLERELRQFAANLVAISKVPGMTGLTWADAFATITSKPAEIAGLGAEIGSLRPGRRADVVVWNGDPLELASIPVAMFVDGRPAPIRTRLTELRDRYRRLQRGSLPKAYVRSDAP